MILLAPIFKTINFLPCLFCSYLYCCIFSHTHYEASLLAYYSSLFQRLVNPYYSHLIQRITHQNIIRLIKSFSFYPTSICTLDRLKKVLNYFIIIVLIYFFIRAEFIYVLILIPLYPFLKIYILLHPSDDKLIFLK